MRLSLCTLLVVLLAGNVRGQGIVNAGFESWNTNGNDTIPTDWSGAWAGVGRTSDSHSGNYAMYVNNWYYYGEGYLTNGNYDWTSGGGAYGTPYSSKPQYLQGYYKYDTLHNSGSLTDSGYVDVILQRYNSNNHERDTVARGSLKLGPGNSYKQFQVEIADLMPGVDPDTIIIHFASCVESSCFCMSDDGTCLYLYVDELSLVSNTSVEPLSHLFVKAKAVPNPFSTTTRIEPGNKAGAKNVRLYNLYGRQVREWQQVTTSSLQIERKELPAGMYYLNIESGRDIERLKLVIE